MWLCREGCVEPSREVFSKVKSAWEQSDLVIANLETALLRGPDVARDKCLLKGDPRWAEVLNHAGVDVVALATTI